MFAAPAICPGTCACSCGRWSGASFSPRNSSGERTSTNPVSVPTLDTTSSRKARTSGCSSPRNTWLGRLIRRHLADQLATLELPLLPAAVQQLHSVEATQLQEPIRVGGEPVVVPAVEDDRGLGADAGGREQIGEAPLVFVVAADVRVQIGRPVPAHRAADVTLLVGGGVLVHLDDADGWIVEMGFEPVRGDQRVGIGVLAHCGCPFWESIGSEPGRAAGLDQPTARQQHRRDGIIAATSPRQRVRITCVPLRSVAGARSTAGRYLRQGQKTPSAAFASSDIISGLHAGRNTSSGRTSPMPSIGARKARI